MLFSLISFSSFARELNRSERRVIAGFEQAIKVMDYMVREVDTRRLRFTQRLNFGVLRQACVPLELLLLTIEQEDDLEDQTEALTTLMLTCHSGVVQVTDIYLEQGNLY